jgi:hypothetical protein
MTFKFTVEHEGKTFDCERVVTGTRVLYQTVYVVSVGSKADSAAYGHKGRPPETMESIARLIAHEILRDSR